MSETSEQNTPVTIAANTDTASPSIIDAENTALASSRFPAPSRVETLIRAPIAIHDPMSPSIMISGLT